MKRFNLLCILSILLFLSCQNKSADKKEIAQLVQEWQGKEIVFPGDLVFTRMMKDTVDFRLPESKYKILVYTDALGCTSCKLQLRKWKELIAHVDTLTSETIPFLFFFHSNDYKEIEHLLKVDRFNLPVCIDINDDLNKLNKFPPEQMFQTFLLDEDNRVVVIGNPIHNPAIKELYLEQITGKGLQASRMIKTTVEVDTPEINMGHFKQSETKEAVFKIRNTGDSPLVIVDVATTCGCAKPTFDRHPAAPGETLEVKVAMSPTSSGFFDETLVVRCNTESQLRLKILGQAE